jgi:hypothetical protein
MSWVKSEVPYNNFIAGRAMQSSVHQEDDSPGWVIGWTEEAVIRAADIVITESQYLDLVEEIQAYNAALPPLPREVTALERVQAEFASAATDTERIAILARLLNLDIS